jgi:Prokaryotic N-terminal methylation motif
MNALRRRLARDDNGLGLVELLVAMLLSGIVLALVATMFINVARATGQSNLTREAAAVAGNIANQVTKTVRFAVQNPVTGTTALSPAVVEATPASLSLISLADANASTLAPSRVRFSVSGGQLLEERLAATDSNGFWVFSGGTPVVRTLGGTVVPPSSGQAPLFRYRDTDGTELVPGPTGLTAAQRERVASVSITLRVRSSASADAPLTVIASTVGMPNLGYAGEGS